MVGAVMDRFVLLRFLYYPTCTIGRLFNVYHNRMDYICYVLEDAVRPDNIKVYGDTAIPQGTYSIRNSMSNRWQKIYPEIMDVPNFTGIRLHGGNSKIHTKGCLLTGRNQVGQEVSHCAEPLEHIIEIIDEAKKAYFIEIINLSYNNTI